MLSKNCSSLKFRRSESTDYPIETSSASSSFTCFSMHQSGGHTTQNSANMNSSDTIQILLNSEAITDEYFNHTTKKNPNSEDVSSSSSCCPYTNEELVPSTIVCENTLSELDDRKWLNVKGKLRTSIRSISVDLPDCSSISTSSSGQLTPMKNDKSKSALFKNKVIAHWLNTRHTGKIANNVLMCPNVQETNLLPKTENAFDALQVPSSISNSCTSNSDQSRSPSPKYPSKRRLFQRHLSWNKGHNYNHHWGTFLNILADVVKFKKNKTGEWFQLGGHQGTFREGTRAGRVLKNFSENEKDQFVAMQNDPISHITPKYCGVVTDSDSAMFIEIEDLLASFKNPSVMDCKMGVRTYLEDELVASEKDPKPRKDLYDKMVLIDDKQPTEEEHQKQAIVKARYMVWRENLSSSALLGFRIEAIKKANDEARKEFQRSKTKDDVKKHIRYFTDESVHTINKFLKRLRKIENVLKESTFFATHELIGSSLLFIYDKDKAGIWLIDFAKTVRVPENIKITHNVKWTRDSHEDGYLIGLQNLIGIFEEIKGEIIASSKSSKTNFITYEF